MSNYDLYFMNHILCIFRSFVDVEFGFDDYNLDVQSVLYLEILNHEDSKVRLAKTEQRYGPC